MGGRKCSDRKRTKPPRLHNSFWEFQSKTVILLYEAFFIREEGKEQAIGRVDTLPACPLAGGGNRGGFAPLLRTSPRAKTSTNSGATPGTKSTPWGVFHMKHRGGKKMKRREKVVAIRFSEEELAVLDRQRGTRKRGAYLREMLLGLPAPQPIPEVNQDAYNASARWAANLNQIARRLNADERYEVNIEDLKGIIKGFRLALLGGVTDDDSENR